MSCAALRNRKSEVVRQAPFRSALSKDRQWSVPGGRRHARYSREGSGDRAGKRDRESVARTFALAFAQFLQLGDKRFRTAAE